MDGPVSVRSPWPTEASRAFLLPYHWEALVRRPTGRHAPGSPGRSSSSLFSQLIKRKRGRYYWSQCQRQQKHFIVVSCYPVQSKCPAFCTPVDYRPFSFLFDPDRNRLHCRFARGGAIASPEIDVHAPKASRTVIPLICSGRRVCDQFSAVDAIESAFGIVVRIFIQVLIPPNEKDPRSQRNRCAVPGKGRFFLRLRYAVEFLRASYLEELSFRWRTSADMTASISQAFHLFLE